MDEEAFDLDDSALGFLGWRLYLSGERRLQSDQMQSFPGSAFLRLYRAAFIPGKVSSHQLDAVHPDTGVNMRIG